MLTGKANNTIINHQVVRMQIPLSHKIGESKPDIDPDTIESGDISTNEWDSSDSIEGTDFKISPLPRNPCNCFCKLLQQSISG